MSIDLDRRALLVATLTGLACGGSSVDAVVGVGRPAYLPKKNLPITTIERIDVIDPVRQRLVPTRAYLPDTREVCPVIIFSHGFGGDLGSFAAVGRSWASAGYIVLHPTHADSVRFPDPNVPSTRAAVLGTLMAGGVTPGGERGAAALQLANLIENPAYLESRLADVAMLTSMLETGSGLDPRVHTISDHTLVGMAGHSYGAYTTMVLGGATLSTTARNPSRKLRRHFSAFMAYSPQGSGSVDLTKESFRGLDEPFFAITGTKDFNLDGRGVDWRTEAFALSPPRNKFLAIVRDFTHLSFDKSDEAGNQLRTLEASFWDGWLKGNEESKKSLLSRAAQSTEGELVWLRRR